jgi:hypothetical protein
MADVKKDRLAQVITLKVKANPKKAGSAAHERFGLYRNGMTVGRAIEAGVWAADVRWDSEHGFIELGAAKARKPKAPKAPAPEAPTAS